MKQLILILSLALATLLNTSKAQSLLMGMTSQGGDGAGVIFGLQPGSTSYTQQNNFGMDYPGSNPAYSELCQAANGKLYGMTYQGGANGMGVLFEYDASTATYTKKLDFNGTSNGSYPWGSLMQAANGKLYGMTTNGGANNVGVLFEYDPSTSTYVKKLDYNGTNGAYPQYGNLIEVCLTPVPTGSLTQSFCAAATVANLTATGTGIKWYNSSVSTTSLIAGTALVNGNHYFATQTNGCEGVTRLDVTVSLNAAPIVSVNSGTICTGSSFTLTPTGATSYVYSSGSNVVSPTTTTDYTVTGTSNGCSTNAIATVSVNAAPTVSVTSGTICTGSSFTLTPTGATSYVYSSGGNVVSPTTTTDYTVTGTDGNGCSSNAITTITVNALPNVTVNSGSICAGSTFILNTNGAVSYTYSNGNSVVSPTTTTDYTVTGSSNGCTNIAVATVTVYLLPNITATSSSSLICAQQTATLSALGALTYTWNNTYLGNNLLITPTITTTYTLIGADANGCENSAVITQSVSTCTSFREINNKIGYMFVYPNPNNGMFTIDSEKETIIVIANLIGEAILTQKLQLGKNNIDLKEQTSGIYFIKNSTSTFKIIKQ